jgi:hypothetical protein
LANLFHRYESLLDTYLVFDSSGDAPRLVAVRLYGNHVIFDEATFGRIQTEASKR